MTNHVGHRLAQRQRQDALVLRRQSDRLEVWVRDLLSYTRPLTEAASAVVLKPLVEQSLADFAREAQRRSIALHAAALDDLPAARGDAMLLAQVLRSLLANALEASATGGEVVVRGHCVPGTTVTISVQDQGVGMTAAELERAGKPFHTTKPRGLGVGLALARRVVERYGGRLVIESEPNRGTLVHLVLKVAA